MDVDPDGGGIVEVEGDALPSCPYTINAAVGRHLNVEAVPALGYRFVGWSGHLSGNENPTSIRIVRSIRISAHFSPDANEFTSENKMVNVIISERTIVLDEEGSQLTSFEFIIDDTPPPLPLGVNIIGLAYDIKPNGVTFDQPISLTWNYDPADVPSGMGEEDLVIAYYDEDTSAWVKLLSEVDAASDTIVAFMKHFTIFAILGFTPPPAACTFNSNGTITETKEITLPSSACEVVAPTVFQNEADTYSVDTNSLLDFFPIKEVALSSASAPASIASTLASLTKFGWWPIGGIMAATVIGIAVPLALKWRQKGAKLSKDIRNTKP